MYIRTCCVDSHNDKIDKWCLICTYIAAGASQRNIGGPSSNAIFIEIGYDKIGTRRFLHKIYCDRTYLPWEVNQMINSKLNEFILMIENLRECVDPMCKWFQLKLYSKFQKTILPDRMLLALPKFPFPVNLWANAQASPYCYKWHFVY